jgi:hypothetical protein
MCALWVFACSDETSEDLAVSASSQGAPKADSGQARDVDWANQLFVTQIYDEQWNPDAQVSDEASNNCGPTSFAMLLAERGALPPKLTPEMSIDHARALMYPSYPELDASALPEAAEVYEDGGLLFVDDDSQPVFFDLVDDAASIAQGIQNVGGETVFGYDSSELDELLETHGALIAHGHITDSWRDRFPDDYGVSNPGSIPHFILVLRASESEQVLVCDPMHKGGAVSMPRAHLQTFFQSPVNAYESSTRVVAWQ